MGSRAETAVRGLRWSEFKRWAKAEGLELPPSVAGSSIGTTAFYGKKVLAVGGVGQGNHRSYEQSHQRRLIVFDMVTRLRGHRRRFPWPLLDLAAEHDNGYLICDSGGPWWSAEFPLLLGLESGLLMVDLAAVQARIDSWWRTSADWWRQ